MEGESQHFEAHIQDVDATELSAAIMDKFVTKQAKKYKLKQVWILEICQTAFLTKNKKQKSKNVRLHGTYL